MYKTDNVQITGYKEIKYNVRYPCRVQIYQPITHFLKPVIKETKKRGKVQF